MECSDDEFDQPQQRANKKNQQATTTAPQQLSKKQQKKQKEAVNIYEKKEETASSQQNVAEEKKAGAESDSDDDPLFKKKKKVDKKGMQKQKRGGNRQKKGQDNDNEDDDMPELADVPKEAEAGDNDEEVKEVPIVITYPLKMIYCGKCGLPPEYCEWSGKKFDQDECKAWVQKQHPTLFDKLYEPKAPVEGQEESKEEEPKKKKKKAVTIKIDRKIRCIKLKRGGKKIITSILGFELFNCDLNEVARIMGKKFGTGAAATLIEHKEITQEGVQVQGDVEGRMEDFINKDLAKYEIPFDCVTFEDGGNFKTR